MALTEGTYDVIVLNKDGKYGILKDGFEVKSIPEITGSSENTLRIAYSWGDSIGGWPGSYETLRTNCWNAYLTVNPDSYSSGLIGQQGVVITSGGSGWVYNKGYRAFCSFNTAGAVTGITLKLPISSNLSDTDFDVEVYKRDDWGQYINVFDWNGGGGTFEKVGEANTANIADNELLVSLSAGAINAGGITYYEIKSDRERINNPLPGSYPGGGTINYNEYIRIGTPTMTITE